MTKDADAYYNCYLIKFYLKRFFMSPITYLTADCQDCSLLKRLLIKPYGQSVNNFKLAFSSKICFSRTITGETSSYEYRPSLLGRVKHFIAGTLLLVPVINAFVISLLLHKDKKTIKSIIKIQSLFRSRNTRKILQEYKAAATKIQSTFRGYRLRKKIKTEIRNQSAIKIQSAFRGWRVRKTYKEYKKEYKLVVPVPNSQTNLQVGQVNQVPPTNPVAKSDTLWQKMMKFCGSKKGMDLATNATGVQMHQASAWFSCAAGSIKALSMGKFKIATALAIKSIGHGINATIDLVVPREVKRLDKLSNPRRMTTVPVDD